MAQRELDPGHPYAKTANISFKYYEQTNSPSPFGYTYYISLPPSYESSSTKHWPLVVFLHGAGESQRASNESYAALRHGIPKLILCYDKWKSAGGGSQATKNWPSIDIPLATRLRGRNPNQGRNRGDADLSGTPVDPEVCRTVAEEFVTLTPVLDMNNGYGWNSVIVDALIDEVLQHYRIDQERIHLTGFSMGGYGTWDTGLHSPDRFATLTPICGGGDTFLAKNIKHIPHWVHHGELDDIIPISASEKMVAALRKAGAREVKFSRYPELAHDSWTRAYGDIELWRWMLERRKESSALSG